MKAVLLVSVALTWLSQGENEIVSIVMTEGGVERGATRYELAAYQLYNQGVALSTQNEHSRAIAKFEEAIKMKADFPEALINLGNLYADHVSLSAGLQAYARAKECADHTRVEAQALSNLAYTLHRMAKKGEKEFASATGTAKEMFEQAIGLWPEFVDAHFNYGSLLQDVEKSSEAEAQYVATLALDPRHENARLNLANIYFSRGESARAAAIQSALANDSSTANKTRLNALNNLGQTFRDADEHGRAAEAFARALEAAPNDPTSLANLATARRTLCEWHMLEKAQLQIIHGADEGVMPYDALLVAGLSNRRLRDRTRVHLARKAQFFAQDRHAIPVSAKTKLEPLVVGYLSYDFRQHPMGYLTRRLVSGHDYRSVRTVALSYGENDGSAIRRRAELLPAGGFIDLGNASIEAAARAIREARLDVVVDLMAHTRGARLELAAIAASTTPVVLNYLGYPGTAGGSHFDYTIADARVAPPEAAQDAFAEPVLLLPRTYQANDYGVFSPTPDPNGPARRLRLCNFNNVDKFEPASWTTWMNVLRRRAGSTLTLLKPKGGLGDGLTTTLGLEAAARGVSPRRIIWAPRLSKARHLQRVAIECDCFVDNFIYGAHTTASDALWAGVPLITLRGYGTDRLFGRFASRVGLSLLHEASDLAELAALDTVKDLENAISVGRIVPRAVVLAASLSSSLFDSRRAVRDLERAYRAAYEMVVGNQLRHHIAIVEDTSKDAGNALKECSVASVLTALGGEHECPDAHLYEDDEVDARNNTVRAVGASLRLVAAFPADADARHARGLALHFSGDQARAAAELEIAARLAPRGSLHFWANLGHVRRAQGNLFEAAAAYLAAGERSELRTTLLSRLTDPIVSLKSMFAASVLDNDDTDLKLRLGAALDDIGRGADALDEWLLAVPVRHEKRRAQEQTIRTPPSASLSVAIICDEYGQTWWPGWGPSSLQQSGLGGSEESVVFLSRELARIDDIHVHVFLENPPSSDIGKDRLSSRLSWWPLREYSPNNATYDIFVAWRYHISVALAPPMAKSFVWLQDVPPYSSWTPNFVDRTLKGIFVLSNFHALTLPEHARHKTHITPNGIDPDQVVDRGRDDPLMFAYGSAPNRGLYDLLKIWPTIRAALPNATLRVFYGFSKSFVKWGTANIPAFEVWRAEILRLLTQDGVVYEGMVDHVTLAQAYADAGFLLYPTLYPETGCVTLMKAMAMGAIPLTSRFSESVVPELTIHFDLGPELPRTASTDASVTLNYSDPNDDMWLARFAQAAIDAARAAIAGNLDQHRTEMRQYARSRFLWSHVANKWASVFTGVGGTATN